MDSKSSVQPEHIQYTVIIDAQMDTHIYHHCLKVSMMVSHWKQ